MLQSRYDEEPDLKLVSGYFADRKLLTERFTAAETRAGKTPDFRIRQGTELVAYCEVKSPNDPWLDGLMNDAPEGLIGGVRSDPTFNRLTRLMSKADDQFCAVNADRSALNILAYVNHDDHSRFHDLIEAVTGYFHADDGSKEPTMLHIAKRIAPAARRIDCCVWFAAGRAQPQIIFSDSDEERLQRLCVVLKTERKNIKHLMTPMATG